MRTALLRPAAPLAALLLLAGCGGSSGGGAAAGGTSAAPSSAPSSAPAGSSAAASSGAASSSAGSSAGDASSSAAAAAWGHAAGCPSVGRAIPAGAAQKPTVDVDGDGRPDTEFITTQPDPTGAVTFGVRTASGGLFSASFSSASPIARSVLVADVTGHGEVIALASDGRAVRLYAISECQLIPEQNAQGQQYTFDLGFTGYGTGVGCVDANGDGTTDLVGLKYVPESQGEGTIQRTIVTLRGPNARNGATDTVPADRASLAEEAQTVTCGDRTMADDGVSSGP